MGRQECETAPATVCLPGTLAGRGWGQAIQAFLDPRNYQAAAVPITLNNLVLGFDMHRACQELGVSVHCSREPCFLFGPVFTVLVIKSESSLFVSCFVFVFATRIYSSALA